MSKHLLRFLAMGIGLLIGLWPSTMASKQLFSSQARQVRRAIVESSPRAVVTYHDILSRTLSSPTNVYVVSDPGDQPDDSLADGILDPPTLRAAVENANRFADLDVITFAPSLTVINKTTSIWPNVIHPVILDGTIAGSGRIAIDGTLQSGGGGLLFNNGGSTIKNCEFRNFDMWGILLHSNAGNSNIVQNCVFRDNGDAGINFNGSRKNLIGGALPAERNYLYGNAHAMTLLVGSDSNSIMGNYIGTPDGLTAYGNTSYGIMMETAGNHLVGNVIVSSGSSGIYISNSQAKNNVIELNMIGVNKDGTGPLGNEGDGIEITNSRTDTIRGNVIAGNLERGIALSANLPDIVIEDNFIGTDALGSFPIPNGFSGISTSARRTVIKRNIISGNRNGIEIHAGDSCTMRDNIIGDYDLSTSPLGNSFFGIWIFSGRGHRIGGPGDEDGNLISGNGRFGIRLQGPTVVEAVIERNLIGTNSTGLLSLGNDSSGIQLMTGTKRDTIRNNIISGNGLDGIVFSGPFDTLAGQNLVTGNLVGLAADSVTALGNRRFGIFLDSSHGNVIGDPGFPGNLIAGNDSSGIRLNRSRQNPIRGNLIGVLPDSTTAAPNGSDGVSLIRSVANTFGGRTPGSANVISRNTGAGIRVFSGSGNRIVGNIIRVNTLLGINLVGQDLTRGVTLNDSADADTGANHLQNFPTLTYVGRSGGNATVHGYLEGLDGANYTVDFYSVPTPDPSGFGSGDSLLDSLVVTPDSTGIAYFTHQLTENPANIVATATSSDGSTSEFSKSPIMVNTNGDGADIDGFDEICNSGGPAINGVPPCALRAAIELAEKLLGPDYIGFEIAGGAPVTIHPNSQLPSITEPTIVDGSTQPGYVEGTPAIRLNGSSAGSAAGIFIEDDASVIRGMAFSGFQAQGVRCSGANLTMHDISVTGNIRSGILCDGDLTVTGSLVASLNGTQVDNDAGIDVDGFLRAESTEVNGNHGNGIRAAWLSIKGDLTATENDAAGVAVISNVLIRGTNHVVSDNGYEGISSLHGWVVVEGAIVADDNGQSRTPSECLSLQSGGITAENEIVLGWTSINGNCGFGLRSGSFVWLKDNCTISNNTEVGLMAIGGEVRLDGPENVISDNGKTGLLANSGIVRVAGKLTLNNNGTMVRNEDPDFCLPGLGDPDSENGTDGLSASKVEARDIVSTNNCGLGIAAGELTISGIAKLNGNSSQGCAARVVQIAAGEICYNGGYGIIVLNPPGLLTGGILSLGSVKVCMNDLGGIFVKPPQADLTRMAGKQTWQLMSGVGSSIVGGSITENDGDGISWQSDDSLIARDCNISGNSGFGIITGAGAGGVLASNIWWGSADGPAGSGPGSGDEVSTGVGYSGWSPSMHLLSLSAPSNVYIAPGEFDSLPFWLSKWTSGNELVNVHIIDTADWVSGPSDFTITASDTSPVLTNLDLSVPGATPEGTQAEIRIVVTAQSNSNVTDTAIVAVFTYSPQLASIVIVPDSVDVQPGGSVNFFAFGLDQFGYGHPVHPVWTTDGGTISAEGFFTAAASTGVYSVSVLDTTELISATAAVNVAITGCSCDCHADPQCDGVTNILDVTHATNAAFRNGDTMPDTDPMCPRQTTDVDSDGDTDIIDVVRITNVAFRDGNPATEFNDPCASNSH